MTGAGSIMVKDLFVQVEASSAPHSIKGASAVGVLVGDAKVSGCPLLHASEVVEKIFGFRPGEGVGRGAAELLLGGAGGSLPDRLRAVIEDERGAATFSEVFEAQVEPRRRYISLRSVWTGGHRFVLGLAADVGGSDVDSPSVRTAIAALEADLVNPFARPAKVNVPPGEVLAEGHKEQRHLRLALLPKLVGPEHCVEESIVILLHHRTMSTVTTILGEGASSVRMFGRIQPLLEAAEAYESSDVVLGGETELGKIHAFQRANSPREYATGDMRDKTVLLKTTNGTRATLFLRKAKRLILASFLNVSAVARAVREMPGVPVLVVCAGDSRCQDRSRADEIMAAFIVQTILNTSAPEERFVLDDPARVLMDSTAVQRSSLESTMADFRQCPLNRELARRPDLAADIDFCTNLDRYAGCLPSYVPFLDCFVAVPVTKAFDFDISAASASTLAPVPTGQRSMPIKKVRLVLLRCGVKVGVSNEDIGLTPKGLTEAKIFAEQMQKNYQVRGVYSSASQRAVQTAEAVSQLCGVPVQESGLLEPMDRGDWEMLTLEEARARFPEDYAQWIRDYDFTGHGGESVNVVLGKAHAALQEIIEGAQGLEQLPGLAEQGDVPTIVVMSHLSFIAGACMTLRLGNGKFTWDDYLVCCPTGNYAVLEFDLTGSRESDSIPVEVLEWPAGLPQLSRFSWSAPGQDTRQSHTVSLDATLSRAVRSADDPCVVSAIPLPKMVMPEHQLQDSLVVLIDVLRMSSTVITGMGEGLRSAELFNSPGDVKKEAQLRSADKCILGGEAKRVLIPGFNRDNSPLSFVNCAEDATALMLTTNGTRALPWVRNAKFLVLGSLLNLHAVVSAIASNLQSVQSVLLVASGQDRGQTRSPDDELCIAMVLKTLVKQLDDPSKLILDETAAHFLSAVDGLDWEQFCDRFRQTHAAKELREIGLSSDVEWCLQVNKYSGVLPVYLHNCDSFVRMSMPGGSKTRIAKIPGRSRRMLRPRADDGHIRVYVVAAPGPPGVFKGRLDSWARITEDGRKIASLLSQEPLEFLFCSPLRRARLIAQEIAKQYFAVLAQRGILLQDPNSVEVHNSLTATDFGEWSGLREDQVRSFLPGALEKWEQHPNFTEHEGESWSQVSTRVSNGLAEILGSERVLSSAKALGIVSHESAVQTIYCQAMGLGQREWCELNILPESVSCFDYIPRTKKWKVVYVGLLAEDFDLRYTPVPKARRLHRERAANVSKL